MVGGRLGFGGGIAEHGGAHQVWIFGEALFEGGGPAGTQPSYFIESTTVTAAGGRKTNSVWIFDKSERERKARETGGLVNGGRNDKYPEMLRSKAEPACSPGSPWEVPFGVPRPCGHPGHQVKSEGRMIWVTSTIYFLFAVPELSPFFF